MFLKYDGDEESKLIAALYSTTEMILLQENHPNFEFNAKCMVKVSIAIKTRVLLSEIALEKDAYYLVGDTIQNGDYELIFLTNSGTLRDKNFYLYSLK